MNVTSMTPEESEAFYQQESDVYATYLADYIAE